MAAAFGEIADAGWRAVELFCHPLDWLGPHPRTKEQLREAGLAAATSFGTVALPTDERQLETLKRQVEYSALLGAEAFGLVGGARLRQHKPTLTEYADLARFCERLADHGAALGLAVGYHPHTACTVENETEIEHLLDQTKTLALCLDASHIALVGEDPVAHLRKYRSRTSYVHLKDWARGAFTEMGHGTIGIDFAAVLRELEEQRFPGWVVVEQSRSEVSPADSARTNARFLRSIGYDPASANRTHPEGERP